MKNLLLLGILPLISISSYAQEELPSIVTAYPDLVPMTLKELQTTQDEIDGIFAESPDGKQITVVTGSEDKQTKVTSFDTDSGKIMWSVVGNYSPLMRTTNRGILLYNYNNSQLLDAATGENVWKNKPSFWKGIKVPVYQKGDILIAYNGAEASPFLGINMRTGERIWKTSIKRSYGIANIYDIDDTHSFIVTNRLYKIDWTTGQTEDIKINIGDMSGKRVWAQIGLGLGLGMYPSGSYAWTGNTMMPVMAAWEVLSGRVSNIAERDGLYYLADQDYIRCFDKNLQVKWQTPLPEDIVTRSRIELLGDTLVMVNLGIAYKGATEPTAKGRPFVAAFDINNGTQLLFHPLANKGKMVSTLTIKSNRVVAAIADSCKLYSLTQGEEHSWAWNKKEFGDLNIILEEDNYIYNSEENSFKKLDPTEDLAINSSVEVYLLSTEEANPINKGSIATIYSHLMDFSDGRSVIVGGSKREDCWVINADGSPYCHIDAPVNKVYDWNHHVGFVLNNGRTLILDK